MADLRTKYMGFELKNPIIAGASNMVTDPETLKGIEKAGAAAVVYKSLFEEQVHLENLELYELRTEYEDRNAEMITLFPNAGSVPASPQEHLLSLKKARDSVSIPLFASLSAVYDETWIEYAGLLQDAGVDGIELNFYTGPEKAEAIYGEIENRQVKILKDVRAAVKIPVSVKLSPFYTNPLHLIFDIDNAGANGFVLFNRLFQPEIDIEKEQHQFVNNLSRHEDMRLPLRFAGLLYGKIKASVCTSSGVFSGSDVIKMLLAGADCVQVVSTLYQNKVEVISTMLEDIEKWMDSRGYSNIDSFRGKLSEKNSEYKLPYHRAQYIDFMMGTREILKKYRTIH